MICSKCKFQMLFNNDQLFYCATNINTFHMRMQNDDGFTPIDKCERYRKGNPVRVKEFEAIGDFLTSAGALISEKDWKYFAKNNIRAGLL